MNLGGEPTTSTLANRIISNYILNIFSSTHRKVWASSLIKENSLCHRRWAKSQLLYWHHNSCTWGSGMMVEREVEKDKSRRSWEFTVRPRLPGTSEATPITSHQRDRLSMGLTRATLWIGVGRSSLILNPSQRNAESFPRETHRLDIQCHMVIPEKRVHTSNIWTTDQAVGI